MGEHLLFVNNRMEIIREFLEAMEGFGCGYEIDATDSGTEAVKLLEEKKYKVVVTGINLSTYGGAKLIEYLNQNLPHTVCIVYTRRIEPAYLKLLVNERRVFRIFQKPTDYKTLYEAIQDGFSYYGSEEAKRQERKGMDQEIQKRLEACQELQETLKPRAEEKEELMAFMQGMLGAVAHKW